MEASRGRAWALKNRQELNGQVTWIKAEGAACARALSPCAKPRERRKVGYEAGETSGVWAMRGFVSHTENFGLYPKISARLLEGSKPSIRQKLQLARSASALAFQGREA